MKNGPGWRQLGTTLLILSSIMPARAAGQTDRTVMVDGLAMHVVSVGLESRNPEQPVVIFESGQGSPLRTWTPILPAVAEFAPVLTYDRSGVGSTPWDGLQPTPDRVVARLHALLDELDVAPPYVLVGHSWGGPLIHRFAGTYPDQVVAMVYIDPTDFMMTSDVQRAMLESLVPGGGWVEWWDRREQQREEDRASRPAASRAATSAVNEYLEREGWKDRPAPDVPTSVIKAARAVSRSDPGVRRSDPNLPYDPSAYSDLLFDTYVGHLRTWVRPGGEFVMATTRRHGVHAAEPEMVVDVIRRVVSGPNSAPPPPVAQDGSVELNDEPYAREAVSVSDLIHFTVQPSGMVEVRLGEDQEVQSIRPQDVEAIWGQEVAVNPLLYPVVKLPANAPRAILMEVVGALQSAGAERIAIDAGGPTRTYYRRVTRPGN